ncbi:MAG: hypothetical protein EOM59_05945 [Clostridia bacterium]|nr:hypothetical protein [Clostridia bacterium]
MEPYIFIGQKLKTTTNEYVTITKIDRDFIYVYYKGYVHKREKSIIGKKLFVIEDKKVKKETKDTTTTKTKKTKGSNKPGRSCNNCMKMKNGECLGGKSICKFYRNSPSISQEEMASWPKYGDATYLRLHGKSRY